MSAPEKKAMTPMEQLRAVWGVAKLSFRTAPVAVIFKLVGSFVDALLPIATTYYAALTTTALADAYGGDPEAKSRIITYILITAVLGLVMTLWRSLDTFMQQKMRYLVETRVSNRMYDHFLNLDFWRYDDKHTVDLYDRAQKFAQFFSWIFDRIATLLSQIIATITAIIALGFVNWWLSFAILLAIVPGVYIQFRLSRQQIKHWNSNVETRRTLNMVEWNMLQPKMISELRLYGVVSHLLSLRLHLRDKDEKKRLEIEQKNLPLTLLSDVLEAVAEVGSLIWISLQIIVQKEPLGQFVYVQQIVSRAISSANGLVSTLASIDEDVANLVDYEQFMQLPLRKSVGKTLTELPNIISLNDVSFHYLGENSPAVLKNISVSISKNQHVAIVGENGAGKSTLIKLLMGLYAPTTGSVMLDADSLQDINIASWHKQLGVLQQDFITYGFATARENVEYGDIGAPKDDVRLERAMKDAEAYDFVDKLPRGVDSYVNNWMEDDDGNKGTDLSGGQWQRLALARDFYRDAPIVILDEPTSAIDALAEARIFNRLFKGRQRTVITISHRLSTVKKADAIYMLRDGELVESGTYEELIAKKGEFYRMFEAQL